MTDEVNRELIWARKPQTRTPILVAAFEGWNDAGEAASTAVRHLIDQWRGKEFAAIEPEEFFDFSSTRPEVHLVDGRTREIEWPSNTFHIAPLGTSGRDVILLLGNEPQLRWKTFCKHVIDVARTCNVEMVVTLGALLADVPHTRPVRITGTAADPEMIEELGLQRSRYEGPTGIVGVLHDALARAGFRSCSLWAAVPHYLPGTPSPRAALALLERASTLLRIHIPTLSIEINAAQYDRQVDEVVEADDDMVSYVRRLELSHDAGDDEDDDDLDDTDNDRTPEGSPPVSLRDANGDLPTGDDLAAELEKYLRDQE
jgi:proteasome assembly chaperone (PAC2) family protein